MNLSLLQILLTDLPPLFVPPSKLEFSLIQLVDEFNDTEFLNFAVENISELFGYLATGRVNIRIHRDITGEMWFGVG